MDYIDKIRRFGEYLETEYETYRVMPGCEGLAESMRQVLAHYRQFFSEIKLGEKSVGNLMVKPEFEGGMIANSFYELSDHEKFVEYRKKVDLLHRLRVALEQALRETER